MSGRAGGPAPSLRVPCPQRANQRIGQVLSRYLGVKRVADTATGKAGPNGTAWLSAMTCPRHEGQRPVPRVILPNSVIYMSGAPTALRAIRLAVALSVATAGSGLPMCVSLVAQAAAPCDMHSGHTGAATHEHAAHSAALMAQSGQACHQDATGLGCAAGSTCPTGSPATGVWAKVLVGLRATSRTGIPGPHTTFVSYFAPPLSPPPQA